ncbi:MAG: response regulator [Candidatus Omnitrophica bacterium]|nr:response regulator [Candidatus Omnitrophota bacterium]
MMLKIKILVVDDDPDIRDLILACLEGDFQVATAATGEEAMRALKKESPDLVILDYMLPDTNGTEICQALRRDPLLLHLPVLMLTGKGETEDKVKGLESGADDYMVKPFNPEELEARIRMLIRRSNINLDANPLTRLPGNASINRELEAKIRKKEPFAVLYLDIDHFKALNDYYGFEKGDEVIRKTGRLIISAVQKKGTVNDFIGHIGGDDFVVITEPDKAEAIAKEIILQFDGTSPSFFEEKDRKKKSIETQGRDGEIHAFGFLSVSIGILTNHTHRFSHTAEISSLGAEMKAYAKKFPGSKYIFDTRSS